MNNGNAVKRTGMLSRPGWLAAVVLLSLALVGSYIASSTLLVVGSILVEGSETLSSQEVIRLSGLSFGQSMLSLDEDQIRANIESYPYLRFAGLVREYPSRVIIKVSTREAAAIIPRGNKDALIVDFNGEVLSLLSATGAPSELTYISNADVPDALCYVGANLAGEYSSLTMRAAFDVLNALKSQDALSIISELNAGELDNLYLVTLSGIKVMLGRADDSLAEKVAMMRAVLPELANEGVRDGLLDVTAGNKADYRRISSR